MKCILICILIVCGGFASQISALRCISPDGLTLDEVRGVIKRCMKKVGDGDAAAAANGRQSEYEEYDNFEDSYERHKPMPGSDRTRNYGNNQNYNLRHDHQQQQQQQPYYHGSQQTGGNYRESNGRNGWLQNHQQPQQQQQQQQHNPYQFTYNDNNNFNGQSNGRNSNSNNNNNGHRNDSTAERDRSCIVQCFFQELKMVLAFLLCAEETARERKKKSEMQFCIDVNFLRNYLAFICRPTMKASPTSTK